MRFTIRDLLWLTVVVALGVAWWVDWGRLIRANARWEMIANTLLNHIELDGGEGQAIDLPDGTFWPEKRETAWQLLTLRRLSSANYPLRH